MELFLTALMVIGIFVVAPTLIGLGIVGGAVVRERIQIGRVLKHEAAATATATKVEAPEQERELVAAGHKQ